MDDDKEIEIDNIDDENDEDINGDVENDNESAMLNDRKSTHEIRS